MSRRKEERSKQGQTNNKAKQHVHVQSSYNRSLLVHVHVYRHMQERYTYTPLTVPFCVLEMFLSLLNSFLAIFSFLSSACFSK